MTATISIHLTLSDGFTQFDLFGTPWMVVKIGQRDDDYEPGYIAIKHSASISIECDADVPGLSHAITQLTGLAAPVVADCLGLDKSARGDVSISYDFAPPAMIPLVLSVESLTALTSIGLPVTIRPYLDFWVEERESDGAMLAKYERVI